MAYLQPVLHSAQFCLSAYSLFHAYISITNLQQYEEKSEKAAQYSSTAAHDLHKTRTTQTSGTLAILSSLLVSLWLVFKSSDPSSWKFIFNAANLAICFFARAHVAGFWEGKTKVPLVRGYNDAVTSTNIIKEQLGFLGASWAVTSVIELLRVLW